MSSAALYRKCKKTATCAMFYALISCTDKY